MLNYRLFKENGFPFTSIKKINNSYVISNNQNKYFVKKEESNYKLFNYLATRSFINYPKNTNIDKYTVYEYIDNQTISKEETLTEIINLIALLHTKTTRYQNISLDDYKIIYEDINNKIENLKSYYTDLNNVIDTEIYMSPSQYYLARNISKIYRALFFCKKELDNWYEIIKTSKRTRKVLIHNNLDISHLIYNKIPYLISWNKAKIDIPIYDLLNLYNKYYNDTDFSTLLEMYNKKYPLSKDELKLFFILISIPKRIELNKNEKGTIKEIKHIIDKLEYNDKIISSFYQKEKSYSAE